MAKILMISLDKNILTPQSAAAERMKKYGQSDEIFIIIPAERELGFDLSSSVHVFSISGNKLIQFFRLKALGNKIIKEQKIDLITAQDPFFVGLIGWLLGQQRNIPWEAQVHGDFFGSNYYRRGNLKNRIRYLLGKFLVKRADKIRVAGERVRESLVRMGIAIDKIMVRPIIVDTDYIRNYQPRLNLRERYPVYEKIFLVLGRLELEKNVSWLIDVFKEVVRQKHNWLLLIVGSGEEESALKLQVTGYRLQENIKFEGWTDDPYSYLKTADCLLFPSLSEGYGLVAMEAAAAGMSVIMSDVGVAGYELKQGPKVKILLVNDREEFKRAVLSI